MNKKQKKEPFSLKNMNGLSHDDARTCALDDMNCLNGQEEHRFSLQDMNATRSRPYRKVRLEHLLSGASGLMFLAWFLSVPFPVPDISDSMGVESHRA